METETLSAPFDEHLGVEYLELGPGRVTARVEVVESLKQPFGIVHGGVHSALAESVASKATNDAVRHEDLVGLGQAIETKFLRPIGDGHVNAEARVRHHGRTTWVWDVELSDDLGHVCALARVTIAIRPRSDS